jgi:hypothetical protein
MIGPFEESNNKIWVVSGGDVTIKVVAGGSTTGRYHEEREYHKHANDKLMIYECIYLLNMNQSWMRSIRMDV